MKGLSRTMCLQFYWLNRFSNQYFLKIIEAKYFVLFFDLKKNLENSIVYVRKDMQLSFYLHAASACLSNGLYSVISNGSLSCQCRLVVQDLSFYVKDPLKFRLLEGIRVTLAL